MQRELALTAQSAAQISSAGLRRSLFIASRHEKLKIEPDSSSSWFLSKKFGKILFGREFTELFKFQAGVRIAAPRQEHVIHITPRLVTFSARPFEGLQLTQSYRIHSHTSPGFTRTTRLVNRSGRPMRLRLISVHDPTSLHFRKEGDPPGEIGVNAFNRGGHIVMDDVADSAGVRVLGFRPTPKLIYMTREKQRVGELLSAGELPEQTAGLSGSIAILVQHDIELAASASAEIRVASVYDGSRLEEALTGFNSLIESAEEGGPASKEPTFSCSSQSLNFSFAWARSRLESMEQEDDVLDVLFAFSAAGALRPDYLKQLAEKMRQLQRRDGLLPHSADPARPGVLETALFLIGVCEFVLIQQDRKLSRSLQPALRRAADSLISAAKGGLINCDPSLPQGWRRRLRSGYPSGGISEVNLAASRALEEYASFGYSIGRGIDSAKYMETSRKIISCVREKLTDQENGMLALNLDDFGRQHREVTIDSVAALSYTAFDHNAASSVVHRLLEKDFETGYGPRTVPTSNPLYFNSSYAEGQLGGYCTRAALGHAILAYACGYAGIGSTQLEKVARLVHLDCEKMGGVPGEFPYWLDPDRRLIPAGGSDLVAASRLVDAIVYGELGLSARASEVRLSPVEVSKLSWLSAQNFFVGSPGSIFVGREGGRAYSATTFQRTAPEKAMKFNDFERIHGAPALECVHFSGPTQLLCAGNPSASGVTATVSVPVRDKTLGKSLFARIEQLDPGTGSWSETERVRLSGKVPLTFAVGPGSWKMMRITQITP